VSIDVVDEDVYPSFSPVNAARLPVGAPCSAAGRPSTSVARATPQRPPRDLMYRKSKKAMHECFER
jgi:hypothetical protein